MSMGADGRWRRRAALAALSAAALSTSGLPSPSVRDVRLAFDGGRLEIGAVRANTGVLGVAFAQGADATLDNVMIVLGGITYRLPSIAFSGASLSRAELMSLFDAAAGEPVGPRLARLSAREIRIPEVRIEQELGGAKQVTVYRDV